MAGKALIIGQYNVPYHGLEASEATFRALTEEVGLEPDVHDDLDAISLESMPTYSLFLNYWTGGKLRPEQLQAVVDFVRGGKGLVGVHSATCCFQENPEYIELIGAQFRTHPQQLEIRTEIVDREHPITKGLKPFTSWDELYLFFEGQPKDVHVLAQTNSYEDMVVPVAWVREPGAGRVFYLSLGHGAEAYGNEHVVEFLRRGMRWALG